MKILLFILLVLEEILKQELPIGKINNEIEDLAVEFFSDLSQLSYVKIQSY